tara:strand:- start:287 stop:559 length:273 start_codon:yes stop_codon:yes gene_type:complete
MNLYQKVERVIQEHINEHQSEVRKGKELMTKLDVARCNSPAEDYSYDLTATGEKMPVNNGLERKSIYYYDYTRNDPTRKNPFEIPDYTEL